MRLSSPSAMPGHDRLFLLDDHARVGANGAQVEVVLNAEGETQHQRQQQQEPGSKTLYLGRKLHAKLRGTYVHLTLVDLEELTHSAFIFTLRSRHPGVPRSSWNWSSHGTLRSSELCIIDYFFIAHN